MSIISITARLGAAVGRISRAHPDHGITIECQDDDAEQSWRVTCTDGPGAYNEPPDIDYTVPDISYTVVDDETGDVEPEPPVPTTLRDDDSGVTYREHFGPDGEIGLRATTDDGRERCIVLNPSGGSDDGVPTVFIYQGPEGSVHTDMPVSHYVIEFGAPQPGDFAGLIAAEQQRLERVDATPPFGGWYSTAVSHVADKLGMNGYVLDRIARHPTIAKTVQCTPHSLAPPRTGFAGDPADASTDEQQAPAADLVDYGTWPTAQAVRERVLGIRMIDSSPHGTEFDKGYEHALSLLLAWLDVESDCGPPRTFQSTAERSEADGFR